MDKQYARRLLRLAKQGLREARAAGDLAKVAWFERQVAGFSQLSR